MKKKSLSIFLIVSLLLVGIIVLINITPIPMIIIARNSIFPIPQDIRNQGYEENGIHVLVNQEYPSKYENNKFDIYQPENRLEGDPVIVWVHGGGFIGGGKVETKEFAMKLAEVGYTVVAMDYVLVPEKGFPTQINQIGEIVHYLSINSENYSINMDNFFIAGNSAGAQLVSQFLLVQTSSNYAEEMKMMPVLQKEQIKGVLLYCGIYSMVDISEDSSLLFLTRFFMDKIGWAYFDNNNWKTTRQAKLSSTYDYLTKDFPKTYITDGNTMSFANQGKCFLKELDELEVEVKSRFFDDSKNEVRHDYQYKLDSEAGKKAFNDTIDFLDEHRVK